MSGSWLVSYRATNGQQLTTQHGTRAEAFQVLADSLFASALKMWELDDDRYQASGDMLVRHALRLTAEADTDEDAEYLLRLSQGRRWLVCRA